MLIDTKRLVPSSKFRAHMPRYIAQSRREHQPIAISHNGEVVGCFVSIEEVEELMGAAVRELLADRWDDGGNVAHATAKKRIGRRSRRRGAGAPRGGRGE